MPDSLLCAAPIPVLVADDPIFIPSPGGNFPDGPEFRVMFVLLLPPPKYPGDVTRGGVGASMMDPNCGCGEVVLGMGDEMEGGAFMAKGALDCVM